MKTLVIVSILLLGKCYSQNIAPIEVPPNYKVIASVNGDLDKDGTDETVIAYETRTVDADSFFTKELYIYKKTDAHFKLWKRNTTVLFSNRDSFDDRDHKVGLKIKNNTLIIEQTFHGSSSGYDDFKNIYRFQNGDWYLIGATTVSDYSCRWKDMFDINFSTNRVNLHLENQCCSDVFDCDENEPDKKFSFKYPFEKILMDKFTPGKHELKIPDGKGYFTF